MTQVRIPRGFQHPIYKGGQFGPAIHAETEAQLNDPPRIQSVDDLLERRREALANQGYVPPAALTVDRSADNAERWWRTQHLHAEHGHRQGDFPLLPESSSPSGRRTVRVRYEGSGVELRMPSVTAIRRFDKEVDGTFDVPVSATFQGGEVTGWVRVTRNGDRWATKGLGFSDTADAQVAEAMAALLEARRPTRALREAGDLIERRRARAFTGAPFQPVRSRWIEGLAYENSSNTMVMRTSAGNTYGYKISRGTYEQVLRAESPGRAYNELVKHKTPRAVVTQCGSCGRFSSAGQPHSCPTGHRDRPGPSSSWTEARNRIRQALTRSRQPTQDEPAPGEPPPAPQVDPEPPEAQDDTRTQAAILQRVRERRARRRRERVEGLSDDEVRDQIGKSAEFWAHRYDPRRVDPQELAQEVAKDWYRKRRDAAEAAANGETVTTPENIRGYIHRTTQNLALVMATGFKRSEDRKAMATWRERCEAEELKQGRPLSAADKDRFAEEIRMSMPPRRRPSKGYQNVDRRRQAVDIDLVTDILTESDVPGSSPVDDSADVMADRVSQIGRGAARKMAWNTVAEFTGAPPTEPGRLGTSQAARARRKIREIGGVAQAIEAWRHERLDGAGLEALFAPFGNPGFGAQERIIDTLTVKPAYAEPMWTAAVAASTQ